MIKPLFLGLSIMTASDDPLPTIVSIDYCADQYTLALADRTQIMALSNEAQMNHSYYRDQAVGIPQIGTSFEEVLALKPDIVLRTWQGNTSSIAMMEAVGIKVVTVPYVAEPEALADSFITIGDTIGRSSKGAEIAAAKTKRLQKFQASAPSGLKGIYVSSFGFTGPDSGSMAKMIELAGVTPMGDILNVKNWQPVPLEKMISNPPDMIIGGYFDGEDTTPSHWSLARHTLYKQQIGDIPVVEIPSDLLSCNDMFLMDAADLIKARATEVLDAKN